MNADVTKTKIELAYREHGDRLRFIDRMMTARMIIISITAVIVIGLICIMIANQ